jgi:site-specific recombinase XerD
MTDTLTEFEAWLAASGRSPNTRHGYRRDLQAFAGWLTQAAGVAMQPDLLTLTEVQHYRRHLLDERQASARTFNRHLAAIRAFLRWALETGHIEQDPLRGLAAESEARLSPHWLERRDVAALERTAERAVRSARTWREQMRAVRDQAILTLLLHTGLRLSELSGLEVGDVRLRDGSGTLAVRHRRQRLLPLNPAARQALVDWLEIRPRTGMAALLVEHGGRRLSTRTVQARLATLGRAAGVRVSAHTLRHTFARNLLDGGVGLEQVAGLLGHQDSNTTRMYTMPSRPDLAQAVEVLA